MKKSLERVKVLIRKNLVKRDLADLVKERQEAGDEEAPACGICIEEFGETVADARDEAVGVEEPPKADFEIV